MALHDEPAQRHLDRRRQAGGEQVRGELRVHREDLVGRARRELDAVLQADGRVGGEIGGRLGVELVVVLLLVLVGESLEGLDDDAGVGAVVDEDGGGAHPGLEVVQAEGDVLGVVSVKHPDFSVR